MTIRLPGGTVVIPPAVFQVPGTMAIIDRYLLREIIKPWLGISFVVLGIFMSVIALKFLAEAASGLLPGRIILDLIGLRLIASLEFLLPTTLFFSMVFAFGRLYADSEMTALFACGVGLNRVIRVVFSLSLLVAALVASLSLYARPWASDAMYRLRDQAMAEFDLSKLDGGNFYQIPLENRIFFADAVDHDRSRAIGVFVETKRGNILQVISAKELYQRQNEGGGKPVLVFVDGYLYEFPAEGEGGHIFGFRESTMSLEGKGVAPDRYRVKATDSARLALSEAPEDVAEWQGRLAAPLSTVLLALLAVPLSRSGPREGRYARIVSGVVIYALYFNVGALAKSWVQRAVVPFVPGIWWVPALLAGLVLALLREQVRDLFRRNQPPGRPA